MVRKVEYTLFDDFTGEPADRTVTFGFDGSWFELDLTTANAEEITDTLTRWSTAGRARLTRTETSPATRNQAARKRAAAIRAWAHDNGMNVSARGRISNAVFDAYNSRPIRSRKKQ